ncbi:MAG TPA: hypothetical protein DEQ30_03435 [Porphyromonadaceae bacterium]|nr:hypothetical protein [Porphyromonadaceae bacterium]
MLKAKFSDTQTSFAYAYLLFIIHYYNSIVKKTHSRHKDTTVSIIKKKEIDQKNERNRSKYKRKVQKHNKQ